MTITRFNSTSLLHFYFKMKYQNHRHSTALLGNTSRFSSIYCSLITETRLNTHIHYLHAYHHRLVNRLYPYPRLTYLLGDTLARPPGFLSACGLAAGVNLPPRPPLAAPLPAPLAPWAPPRAPWAPPRAL